MPPKKPDPKKTVPAKPAAKPVAKAAAPAPAKAAVKPPAAPAPSPAPTPAPADAVSAMKKAMTPPKPAVTWSEADAAELKRVTAELAAARQDFSYSEADIAALEARQDELMRRMTAYQAEVRARPMAGEMTRGKSQSQLEQDIRDAKAKGLAPGSVITRVSQ